ncbi:MAG TPA: hypothetical protein DEG69_04405 [Flavobacteriaceae bacterium]|nr:hypothetical protein [Flavobacteriaceae bacterium]
MKITEGLKAGDLEGIVSNIFSVDQYKSKMGEDKDICVLAFTVDSQQAAKDLESFAEKGYKNVLDADATPGTLEDGKYKVFVEFPRNEKLDLGVAELLEDLKKLANIENFKFTYHKGNAPVDATRENLSTLPQTAEAYKQKVNNLRVGETKNFFDKFNMMEMKLADNIMTIKKEGLKDELKFEIHSFGPTQEIVKETKAFLIDSNSMAEVMHLTKYFGPYNITKTNENRFIFSKAGESAVLSKYKW